MNYDCITFTHTLSQLLLFLFLRTLIPIPKFISLFVTTELISEQSIRPTMTEQHDEALKTNEELRWHIDETMSTMQASLSDVQSAITQLTLQLAKLAKEKEKVQLEEDPSVFGTSGITSFATSSSVIGSSVPAAKPFSSGTTFALDSSTSSSDRSTIGSSSAATSSIFSSSWQTSKSPVIGSVASSSSPSTGFSFGASFTSIVATNSAPMVFGLSTGTSSSSMFSFTSATATTSSLPFLSQSQRVFGNTAAFRSLGNSGDQMNMEDSMAEDPVNASTPTVPVFGQPLVSPSPAGFMFGSTAPSPSPSPSPFQFSGPVNASTPTVPVFGQPLVAPSPAGFMFGSTAPSPPSPSPSPFQLCGQLNPATPQNPFPFHASNSLDFSEGGSFLLGSGGGGMSARKIVRTSRSRNRKK